MPNLKKPYGLHSTGCKIRYIRERKGISKSDLSQACNVSPAALNHWEIGIRTPDEEAIVNLAKAMNIDAASLFDRRIRTMVDVAHILFEMADDGFIEPESDGIRVMNRTLFEVMLQWHEKYQQWKSGQITNEEYYDWQDSFTLATTDSETK